MINDLLYPIARYVSRWLDRLLPHMGRDEFTIVFRFAKFDDKMVFEQRLMLDADALQNVMCRDLQSYGEWRVAGIPFEIETSEQSWARSIPVPKARLRSESSPSFCVDADIWLAEDSSLLAEETLQTLCVRRLTDAISKSSELKQAISTLGSAKLSKTQAVKLRLSFTGEIAETGLGSHAQKTSST